MLEEPDWVSALTPEHQARMRERVSFSRREGDMWFRYENVSGADELLMEILAAFKETLAVLRRIERNVGGG